MIQTWVNDLQMSNQALLKMRHWSVFHLYLPVKLND
jgi:hypothetical protein